MGDTLLGERCCLTGQVFTLPATLRARRPPRDPRRPQARPRSPGAGLADHARTHRRRWARLKHSFGRQNTSELRWPGPSSVRPTQAAPDPWDRVGDMERRERRMKRGCSPPCLDVEFDERDPHSVARRKQPPGRT